MTKKDFYEPVSYDSSSTKISLFEELKAMYTFLGFEHGTLFQVYFRVNLLSPSAP